MMDKLSQKEEWYVVEFEILGGRMVEIEPNDGVF